MARKTARGAGPGNKSADELMRYLAAEMERHPTAEALNDQVLIPFIAALEKIANARGYVLNIYGESSNLVISSEEHAEQIYYLVDQYLDVNVTSE